MLAYRLQRYALTGCASFSFMDTSIQVGPLTFEYWRDGDDSNVGQLRVSTSYDWAELQITHDEWEQFTQDTATAVAT